MENAVQPGRDPQILTRENALLFALRTAKIGEDHDTVLLRAKKYEDYVLAVD